MRSSKYCNVHNSEEKVWKLGALEGFGQHAVRPVSTDVLYAHSPWSVWLHMAGRTHEAHSLALSDPRFSLPSSLLLNMHETGASHLRWQQTWAGHQFRTGVHPELINKQDTSPSAS